MCKKYIKIFNVIKHVNKGKSNNNKWDKQKTISKTVDLNTPH